MAVFSGGMSVRIRGSLAPLLLAVTSVALMWPAVVEAGPLQSGAGSPRPGGARVGPSPVEHPSSVVYIGHGGGVRRVFLRLRDHQLIEAKIVFLVHCSITGRGHGRRYRQLSEAEEASRRWPLHLDGRGHFRAYRWEVNPSSDEFEKFVGAVSPRSIVGSITEEYNESAPESGVFRKCKTGPLGKARRKLTFEARPYHPNAPPHPKSRS